MAQAQDALIDRTSTGATGSCAGSARAGWPTSTWPRTAELGRRVAIKILNDRYANDDLFVERFRREANRRRPLPSEHRLDLRPGRGRGHVLHRDGGHRGPQPQGAHPDGGRLRPAQSVAYARQILAALRFAHRNGIIHRDIKPHNILIGPEERLKVTDFGIARAGASQMTEAGSIMGTAQYLSPEQARGGNVTAASDLYSVGVVLYEMLTGEVPFSGDTAVEIAMKHVNESTATPSARAPGHPRRSRPRSSSAPREEPGRPLSDGRGARLRPRPGRGRAAGPRETAEAATAVLAGAGDFADPGPSARPAAGHRPAAPGGRRPPYDPDERPRGNDRSCRGSSSPCCWLRSESQAGTSTSRSTSGSRNRSRSRSRTSRGSTMTGGPAAHGRGLRGQDGARGQRGGRQGKVVIDQNPAPGARVEKGSTVISSSRPGLPQVEVPGVSAFRSTRRRRSSRRGAQDWKVTRVFSDAGTGHRRSGRTRSRARRSRRARSSSCVSPRGRISSTSRTSSASRRGDRHRDAQERRLQGRSVACQLERSVEAGIVIRRTRRGSGEEGVDGRDHVSAGPRAGNGARRDRLGRGGRTASLQEPGFSVSVQDLTANSPDEDGIVLDQDPSEGTSVEPGTTVTIYVGRFTQPEPPPADTTTTAATTSTE